MAKRKDPRAVNFGKRLRAAREGMGLTRKEVIQLSAVDAISPSYLGHVEAGDWGKPREDLEMVCKALGLDWESELREAGYEPSALTLGDLLARRATGQAVDLTGRSSVGEGVRTGRASGDSDWVRDSGGEQEPHSTGMDQRAGMQNSAASDYPGAHAALWGSSSSIRINPGAPVLTVTTVSKRKPVKWMAWTGGGLLVTMFAVLLWQIWPQGVATGSTENRAAVSTIIESIAIQSIDVSDYPNVRVILDVADSAGSYVHGLKANQILVKEQGRPVTGVTFIPVVEAGQAIALAMDTSGSMVGEPLNRAKAAATDFVNKLSPMDQTTVLSFGSQVRPIQGFTSDKERLSRAIVSLVAVGNTKLYDALYIATEEVARSAFARKVVVLVSDGEDTASVKGLDDGINLARSRGVAIFTVGLGPAPKEILQRAASETGGVGFYSPSVNEISQAFESISGRLQSPYVLSYTAPNYSALSARSVQLIMDHPGGTAVGEGWFNIDDARAQ